MRLDADPAVAQLAREARRLFERNGDLSRALALEAAGQTFDEPLWRQVSDLGWAALLADPQVPPEVAVDASVALLEQVGRSQAAVPLASSLIGNWLLHRLDPDGGTTPPSATPTTPPSATATAAPPTRVSEPPLTTAPSTTAIASPSTTASAQPLTAAPSATATPLPPTTAIAAPVTALITQAAIDATDGERPGVTGTAELVRDGAVATEFLCLIPGPGGIHVVRVPATAAGVEVLPHRTAGRLREADVRLTGVAVPPEWLLPRPLDRCGEATLEALRTLLDAAELVGQGRRLIELSVDHANTRVQFGRPLAGFQAVRHRLADMLIDIDVTAALLHRTAAALAAGDDPADHAACLGLWSRRSARRIAHSAHQVHGGVGFIRDHPLHLFFGRQVAAGSAAPQPHRDLIVQQLLTRDTAAYDSSAAGDAITGRSGGAKIKKRT